MVELRLRSTAAGPLERRHDRRDHGRHTELEEGAGGVPRAVGHPERTRQDADKRPCTTAPQTSKKNGCRLAPELGA